MANKEYRNIKVNNVKYQWMFNKVGGIYDDVKFNKVHIFKFDYEYDLYSNTKLDKRRYLKTCHVDANIKVTPVVVRQLILHGDIDNKFIRKLKLKQLDKKV